MPGQWHSQLSENSISPSPLFLPSYSFISTLSSRFFSFSYAWPCPTHLQTFPLPSPQSSSPLLVDNNKHNLTNRLGLIPAQTPPTLTIPPALLIPLLAPVPIAVRQRVHRTSFPCHSSCPLVDFLHLISPTAVNSTSRPQPTPARRSHSSDSAPSDKTKTHRSKGKKGSMHADIIDRLDFTGVGPSTSTSA
jgi:hypothetical protein